MTNDFSMLAGFSDTLVMLKKMYPDRKGQSQFKLQTLATDFLESKELGNFHDAVFDVTVLQKLVRSLNLEHHLMKFKKSFYECCDEVLTASTINQGLQFLTELQGVVSRPMLKRMAAHKITFTSMLNMYKDRGEKPIVELFTDCVESKKARITKNKKIIGKVIEFLKHKCDTTLQ